MWEGRSESAKIVSRIIWMAPMVSNSESDP